MLIYSTEGNFFYGKCCLSRGTCISFFYEKAQLIVQLVLHKLELKNQIMEEVSFKVS